MRTAFAISSPVLSVVGEERNGNLWLCNWFPWNLAPNMCSNSSGRSVILPFPAVRGELSTPHLSARGPCIWPCQCCSWQACPSAQGQCGAARQRAEALAAVCRMRRCFIHWDTPHWKVKDFSLIFSEMFFKQCLQFLLHSTEKSDI